MNKCDECIKVSTCTWLDRCIHEPPLKTVETAEPWKARPYNLSDFYKALDRKRKIVIKYENGNLYLNRIDCTQGSGWDEREIPFDCSNAYDSVVELITVLEDMQGRE